jgi:hypothetical protein
MGKTAVDWPNLRGTFAPSLGFIIFFFLSTAILGLPDHPDAIGIQNFLSLPLEVAGLGLLVLLLSGKPRAFAIGFSTIILGLILFLKLADLGTQAAFQRRFNPYLDIKMLKDGWNLLSGSLGSLATVITLAGAVLVFVVVLVSLSGAMRHMGRAHGSQRGILFSFFTIMAVAGVIAISAPENWARLPLPRSEAGAGPYLSNRLSLIAASVEDMRRFELELPRKDSAPVDDTLFQAVKGRDVILIFVESYGQSTIDDPRYGQIIRPRLDMMTQELLASGFSMASTWVGSPTVGGLSWLTHGTFLSGLWLDSQARYDRLMISERQSLNSLFSTAGWNSVAVMPAITMDWPEAAWYGYDRVLAADDLGYRGAPFNWVTMPDQYTLSAFQRIFRDVPARKPVMAEIALISSHAPWTPIASLIDWNDVGDGTIFNGQATAGETPSEVWADPEKVRAHYIRTVDYSLQTIGSYISRFGEDALFVILGDHQPAAIITGPGASRAVPLHVVSRDRALVERFSRLGFDPGLVPHSSGSVVPMDQMRHLLISTLSATE